MISPIWRFELFGGLRLRQESREITRFRTRKTASLIAYLAYFPGRTPSRDDLVELFWPEAEPNVGRVNLRTALASLRRQLEPPDVPGGSVLITDNNSIRLHPDSFTSDVADFHRLMAAGAAHSHSTRSLAEAVALYRGDLLPGHYDDWIVPERLRLTEACYTALRRLIAANEQSGDLDTALDYALRAVGVDPLREEGYGDLIRLYLARGRPAAALRQYQDLERLLCRELNMAPSATLRALADMARQMSPQTHVPSLPRREALSPTLPTPAGNPHVPLGSAPIPACLPTARTRFFGREEELVYLMRLLGHSDSPIPQTPSAAFPLVTLTGPGGSGKTRLALEVARRYADTLDIAVYFVALADLQDVALLPDKILMALGLPRTTPSEPLAQIGAALRQRPSLLVLDNFEQLADAGIPIVHALCELPGLSCLVTSRQRLGIESEQEFPVRPLPTPAQPQSPADLTAFPSVQLFTDRAQKVRPDFQITAHNAVAIGKLCDRLEGLPLALELAATWAAVLTPTQMLEQMEDRFAFLVSRSKGRPPRHQTLHAAIESSYLLLTPELQRLFARLSIFRGGWTWEAAQNICSTPNALQHLALLRDHSLLLATESGTTMRFSMLETLREFAGSRLPPTEQAAQSERHASYFLAFAEEAEQGLFGAEQALWLERLEAEHDNLRAALAWSRTEGGDGRIRLALPCALTKFWSLRGGFQEGRKHIEEALAGSTQDIPISLHARTLLEGGLLAEPDGDLDTAHAYTLQALRLYESIGEEYGMARACSRLGAIASVRGDYAASFAYQETVLLFWRSHGTKREIASALNNLGNTANVQGSYVAAQAHLLEALPLARELEDTFMIAVIVGNLGLTALYQGDKETAQRRFEECLSLRRQIGMPLGVAASKANLAMVAFEAGDLDTASRLNAEALVVQVERGERLGIAYSLEACTLFAVAKGDYDRAARLGGAAEAIREAIRSPLTLPYFRSHWERAVIALHTHRNAARLRTAWDEGRMMPLVHAVALATE